MFRLLVIFATLLVCTNAGNLGLGGLGVLGGGHLATAGTGGLVGGQLTNTIAGIPSTLGAGHVGLAATYPSAISSQSRFDVVHPGSVVQQTVSHVPVVSSHITPAIALGGHGQVIQGHGIHI